MIEPFKVVIAGGRDFNNYEMLCEVCDHMLQNKTNIIVVSGKARGADSLGERYAKERGYKVDEFPADWTKYNKAAGHIRNEKMALHSNAAIIFWDGKSKGSENMINCAKKYDLKIKIKKY